MIDENNETQNIKTLESIKQEGFGDFITNKDMPIIKSAIKEKGLEEYNIFTQCLGY